MNNYYKDNNDVSIFNEDNDYGYKFNVNHPKINELYRRFKLWKGYSMNFPLTDEQRFEFENYLINTGKFDTGGHS